MTMLRTATTNYPHYLRLEATPDGILPGLAGLTWDDNEQEVPGTRQDPYILTADERTTRTLRSYLGAMGAWWKPLETPKSC